MMMMMIRLACCRKNISPSAYQWRSVRRTLFNKLCIYRMGPKDTPTGFVKLSINLNIHLYCIHFQQILKRLCNAHVSEYRSSFLSSSNRIINRVKNCFERSYNFSWKRVGKSESWSANLPTFCSMLPRTLLDTTLLFIL